MCARVSEPLFAAAASELSQQSKEMLELQRCRMREEIQEYKERESRQLQDYTELEEENISLQKLISTLKQNQVQISEPIQLFQTYMTQQSPLPALLGGV